MNRTSMMLVGAVAAALVTSSGSAQAVNVQEMMKWSAAQVIHYDVVAEYAGAAPIVSLPDDSPIVARSIAVRDRYEISFDWNPTDMTMIGAAVFKNFPASLPDGLPPAGRCPQMSITGTYDHAEIQSARTGPPASNTIDLTVKRTYPAGVITYPNENGVCTPVHAPAKTTTESDGFVVPQGLWFAMPAAVPANVTVGKDGKTMTLAGKDWTYTFTMRIAK